MEAERLARPLIQLSCDRVELMLRQPRQIHALGHVLPEQAVRVFVTSTLPWALRIAEVALNIRGQGELLVGMHLGAPAPGQGLVKLLWQLAGMLDERVDDRLRVFAIELHQHHVARLTLDQRRDLAVATAKDQITFPMPRHSSVFNARGRSRIVTASAIWPWIAVFCV